MPKKTVPDSPSPYNITLKDGFYYFTTSHKREYTCVFSGVNPFLSPVVGIYDIEVYMFDFSYRDPEPHTKKSADERVSATVKHLLMDFFAKNKNRVMIYVCDTADGRGKQRNTLFKKWYENVADEYTCDNVEIEMRDSDPIYGAIVRIDGFPYNDILKTEVIDRAEAIILEKFGQ